MDINELKMMQNYPLWMKIEKTKMRIREWYEHYNGEVYVSFSGGKDSTVLLHIVREMYPDVEAVYSDTGLEYPEVKNFVKKHNNVTIIRPEMSFKRVVEEKGYPIVSKSVSNCVRLAKQNIADGKDTLRVRQIRGLEKGSKFNKGKWEFLLDAPFKISDECCNELKKKPFKRYEKVSNKKPMMATMAAEGGVRKEAYLKTGCNSFKGGKSQPMGFWTENDVLQYIYENKLEIPSVYGEIIKEEDKYSLTGVKRIGCVFCGFGCHLEKQPNRFVKLKESHPKLYDYCMDKLDMRTVLDYIGVEY